LKVALKDKRVGKLFYLDERRGLVAVTVETAIGIVELVLCILVCQVAGFIGSIFTVPSIPTCYRELRKPSFAPPNRIFGPVWITLYALMGMSLYFVLLEGIGNPQV
jgi:benzodiazapine receptor